MTARTIYKLDELEYILEEYIDKFSEEYVYMLAHTLSFEQAETYEKNVRVAIWGVHHLFWPTDYEKLTVLTHAERLEYAAQFYYEHFWTTAQQWKTPEVMDYAAIPAARRLGFDCAVLYGPGPAYRTFSKAHNVLEQVAHMTEVIAGVLRLVEQRKNAAGYVRRLISAYYRAIEYLPGKGVKNG